MEIQWERRLGKLSWFTELFWCLLCARGPARCEKSQARTFLDFWLHHPNSPSKLPFQLLWDPLGLVGSVLSNTVKKHFPKLLTHPRVSTKRQGRPGQTLPDKVFMDIIPTQSYLLSNSYLPGTIWNALSTLSLFNSHNNPTRDCYSYFTKKQRRLKKSQGHSQQAVGFKSKFFWLQRPSWLWWRFSLPGSSQPSYFSISHEHLWVWPVPPGE